MGLCFKKKTSHYNETRRKKKNEKANLDKELIHGALLDANGICLVQIVVNKKNKRTFIRQITELIISMRDKWKRIEQKNRRADAAT